MVMMQMRARELSERGEAHAPLIFPGPPRARSHRASCWPGEFLAASDAWRSCGWWCAGCTDARET